MKTLIVVFAFLSIASFGQSAKVVELSTEKTIKAKQLYETKEHANKAWNDFYASVSKNEGKDFGAIEFSVDFKFIVPKEYNTITNGYGYTTQLGGWSISPNTTNWGVASCPCTMSSTGAVNCYMTNADNEHVGH